MLSFQGRPTQTQAIMEVKKIDNHLPGEQENNNHKESGNNNKSTKGLWTQAIPGQTPTYLFEKVAPTKANNSWPSGHRRGEKKPGGVLKVDKLGVFEKKAFPPN